MSLDQRTHVPQGEISVGEAMVEKGATEVVGAEVETEVAMVETGVGVAMVGIEEVAMEETEVVMVGTEEAAMEETEVATEETEVAMEETEVAMEVIEEAMEVIEVDMEETAAGGPMEETVVVVVVAVEATVETEVEATVETEVVATEETEVATEETEVAMEAKWEEETTTEMISATDHTDDCFRYSFVSDMIRGELSECACCFPHGLLGSEIDIWVFIWVGGLGAVFFLEMSIKKIPFYFPTFSFLTLKAKCVVKYCQNGKCFVILQ